MAVARLTLIKLIELLLVVICVYCHYYSFKQRSVEVEMLITGTFCGFLIILIGDAAGHISSSPGRRLDAFYSLIGAILFIACGIFAIQDSDNFTRFFSNDAKTYGMAKGIASIVNGALFLLDSLFVWRGEY